MPLQAQRPAPPPPGATSFQQRKSNLNSSLRGPSDPNNNKQTSLFSRPTVIRPSVKPSNKFNVKKKPPPRPAPPKNYQAQKRTADPLVSSTPDLLADLQDVFSARPAKENPLQATPFFFEPSSNVQNSSFPFKPSGQETNQSFPFKPPSHQTASTFPFKPVSQQPTSSQSFRPGGKKYQAPMPSVAKSKSHSEFALIDFDSPVTSSRIPQSSSFATSSSNSLLDWDMGPANNKVNQQRSVPTSSILDFPVPSITAQNVNQLSNNPAANFVKNQASSMTTQQKMAAASWAVGGVKQQASTMSTEQKQTAVNWAVNSATHQGSTMSTQQKETAVNWAVHSVKQQASTMNAQQKETAVNWAVSSVKQQASTMSVQQKETAVNWGVDSVKQKIAGRECSPPEPKFPPPPPPEGTAAAHGPVLEVCEVLFDFLGETSGDLSLQVGDQVEVEVKQNQDWWTGHCNGRRGIFPASFVQPLSTKPQEAVDTTDSSAACFAKALYTFAAEDQTDLPFQEGDIVQVLYRINQDWLFGSCQGREGQFPATFVQKMNPSQTICRAVYEFQAENGDELSFSKGEHLVVLEKTSTDWWKGRRESDPSGKVGIFPAAFVESVCN